MELIQTIRKKLEELDTSSTSDNSRVSPYLLEF